MINAFRFGLGVLPTPPTPPFSPSDLSSLAQWYKSETIGDGLPGNWTDSSGNSKTLTRWSVPTVGSFNGYDTLEMNTSQAMRRAANDVFTTPNNCIFLAVKPIEGFVFADYGSVANKITYALVSGSNLEFKCRDENGEVLNPTVPFATPGEFEIFGMQCNGDNKTAYIYNQSGSEASMTNSSYVVTTTWDGAFNPTWAKQSWSSLGGETHRPDLGDCEILEIIIYNETKSYDEINQLGNYLADKYTLSWTNFPIPFSPSDLSSLAQWYKSETIKDNLPGNWTDSSGNSKDLTKFSTPTTGSFNGYDTLKMDNTQAMRRNANDVFTTPNNCIFMVVKPIMDVGFVFADYGNVTNKIILGLAPAAGNTFQFKCRDVGADFIEVFSPLADAGEFEIFGMQCDGDNKTAYIYNMTGSAVSGTNASYDGTTTWDGALGTWAKQSWSALGGGAPREDLGDCEFLEIIIYDETKSLADINNIGNYLADKYSLTWTDF